mmetsp:Transcript_161055/g.296747  ORF Transcript_161055/g.296747 Transcript_161055/m.296747 type:complete len:423 (+) Transcript_161055:72-1340(+)
MSTKVVAMSKKVVVIGGGLSAKHAAETVLKKVKGSEVTVVQANRFVEWPLAMPVVLVNPALHDKALATDCNKFQVPGVTYKYGVAESVDVAARQVKLAGDAGTVPYDVLVIATGFSIPLVYPGIGVSLDERKAEVQRVADAIKKAQCVVVAGGGPVGLELAGDIRIAYPDKKIVLLCRAGILSQWPDNIKQKFEAQLKKMNIEVMSQKKGAPSKYSLEPGTIDFEDTSLAYDVFLPAYSQGPNTLFLDSVTSPGIVDGQGCIQVNEYLQSQKTPEIFAVGVSNFKESFIGIGKLEGQWNSVAGNAAAFLDGKPLKKHTEAMQFMKLPPMTLIGHGSKGYGYLDCNNLPGCCKCCCCCGYAGWPCCPPCWPCCACGGCGCCPLGYCGLPPEGTGPAALAGKLAFMSSGFHFTGVGAAPAQQKM